MSLFLLRQTGRPGNRLTQPISFTDVAREKHQTAGSYEIRVSWICNQGSNPWVCYPEIHMICNGVLYLDGRRVDRQWDHMRKQWHESGTEAFDRLDGYGNLLIYSTGTDEWHIITSGMGMLPVYYGENRMSGEFVIGSHPDQIAQITGSSDIDETSLAEFIKTSSVTSPYTYYKAIRELEPASVYHFRRGVLTRLRRWWKPEYQPGSALRKRDLIERVSTEFESSVRQIMENHGDWALVLLSGGLDSRAVLGTARKLGKHVEAATFYDRLNTETETAGRVAKALHVKHHLLQREYDYYANQAFEAIRITGGMWRLASLHSTGFRKRLEDLNPGVILAGMRSETLFRGTSLSTEADYQRSTGKICFRPADQDVFWDARGYSGIQEVYDRRIVDRRRDYYGFEKYGAEELTPDVMARIKFARIRNLSRLTDNGMDIELQRTQQYDHLLLSSGFRQLLDVFNPACEVDGVMGKKILRGLSGNGASARDANDASSHLVWNNHYLTMARSILKKRTSLFQEADPCSSISTKTSWINWDAYRRESTAIREIWSDCNHVDTGWVTEITGMNPYEQDPARVGSYHGFNSLLTLGIWLRHFKNGRQI